ncbi:TetR family transcriptional regulator [Streptomyces sp. NPDC016845]|uniref:TetR family transcriptional regulator n=1 Tax=Streptomyces sp. NPDC016845 TaxID=3364972 RepID=UPI00379E0E2C
MSQLRARRTRRRLLRAAAQEFARLGYSGARLTDVVDRIGMTKGALYGHFTSKQELAAAVRDEALHRWETLRADVAATRSDALGRLRALAERLVRCMERDPHVRAAVRFAADRRPEPGERDLLAAVTAHVAVLAQQAEDDGHLTAALPARIFTDLLITTVFAGDRSGSDRRTRLNGLWDLLDHTR